MPNLNPREARTYNPAPTLWKYDPQTNILWLKLTDASWAPAPRWSAVLPPALDHRYATPNSRRIDPGLTSVCLR
jgi:hypothetical protein